MHRQAHGKVHTIRRTVKFKNKTLRRSDQWILPWRMDLLSTKLTWQNKLDYTRLERETQGVIHEVNFEPTSLKYASYDKALTIRRNWPLFSSIQLKKIQPRMTYSLLRWNRNDLLDSRAEPTRTFPSVPVARSACLALSLATQSAIDAVAAVHMTARSCIAELKRSHLQKAQLSDWLKMNTHHRLIAFNCCFSWHCLKQIFAQSRCSFAPLFAKSQKRHLDKAWRLKSEPASSNQNREVKARPSPSLIALIFSVYTL